MNHSNATSDRLHALKERAIRLFTFIREVVALKTKTVRSLDNYEQVIWFADIPKEPECRCVAWQEGASDEADQVWLAVKKPRLPPPPALPEVVKAWVNIHDVRNSDTEPILSDRILVETEDTLVPEGAETEVPPEVGGEIEEDEEASPTFEELADHPEVSDAWAAYLSDWRDWAEHDRRKRRVRRIYTDLFTLQQQQKELGESFEVVLGLGHLRWKGEAGEEVNRHLVVAQTNLEFDAEHGVISVKASIEGARPQLEQDMLEPSERPDGDIREKIEDSLKNVEDSLWDDDRLPAAIQSWANSVSEGRGDYEHTIERVPAAGRNPLVHWAPALILRRRTERGYLELYSKILADLRSRADIPEGLIPLVDIEQDDRPSTWDGRDSSDLGEVDHGRTVDDLYFPLPANDEQREIVDRLLKSRGVLVQGPPGTGKSHTIANLVSHLLATGNRVLVTSQTERALRVLKKQIPPAINELAVVLLGHGHDAFEQLEGSVHGITDRLNSWDDRREVHRIKSLEGELDALRGEAAAVAKKLRDIRESDTRRHPPIHGGYSGTLQEIAARLGEEEPRLGWLSEFLGRSSGVEGDPPTSNDEMVKLLDLIRQFDGDKEQDARRPIPEMGELIVPDDFDQLVVDEAEASKTSAEAAEAAEGMASDFRFVSDLPALRSFEKAVDALLFKHQEIVSLRQDFAKRLAEDILAGSIDEWDVLREQTNARLDRIGRHDDQVHYLEITGCDGIAVQTIEQDAEALLEHVRAGGRLVKRWFRYQHPVRIRRYIVEMVRVGGRPATTEQAISSLAAWADVSFQMERLRGLWTGLASVPEGDIARQLAFFQGLCKPLDAARKLHHCLQDVDEQAARITGFTPPAWHDIGAVERVKAAVRAEILRRAAEEQRRKLEALDIALRSVRALPDHHASVNSLGTAITERDFDRYRTVHGTMETLWSRRAQLKRRDDLISRTKAACPAMVDALLAGRDDDQWDLRLQNFTHAWRWVQADRWLARQVDPVEYERLSANERRVRQALQEKMTELAAAKAWRSCMSRMTRAEETHLKGWMQAIQKIGAGTGKRAEKFRAMARQYLNECRSAIPAWIMPLYRVIESITPGEDLFDVVIIDEASQSGIEALFLFYIAKKIVVVGDDKQIAPEYIGITRDDIDQLQRQYLSDIPLRDSYGLEYSFFDQAFLRYRDRVRLREHFRCMPEIIQFSNSLCYQNEPLVPLRQYGADRLEPVVTTVYVEDGFLKGSSRYRTNPPEAEAIVETIASCIADPRYAGMTFGVISLLGEHQARDIETRLLQRIGPEQISERRLICGDAYAFQGDERNVIFMSLVTAPENTSVLSVRSLRNVRRFNVAASRAQDQMWLFHSVTLDDLSPKCLRRRLLEYCLHPEVVQDKVGDLDLSELRRLATNRVSGTTPPDPFDSWFEVDVFLRIHERGYRVQPQFEVANFRIDLVVSGMKERIAVECDGDKWHGPEQYENDQARQRQLERCGWRFVRIRGGAFYRSPDSALEPLWEFLEEHGIRPHADEPFESEPPVEPEVAGHDKDEAPTDVEPRRKVQEELDEDIPQDDLDDVVSVGEAERVTDPSQQEPKLSFELKPAKARPTQRRLFETESDGPPGFPDPRDGDARGVRKGLTHIVGQHGPMPCHYAYRLYVQQAGIQRISKPIRSIFNKAMVAAIRSGDLVQANEYGVRDQMNQIVRLADTPTVVVRPRDGRNLNEIPPSEVAAAMRELSDKSGVIGRTNCESMYRQVLQHYGLVRLTEKTRTLLGIAYQTYSQG